MSYKAIPKRYDTMVYNRCGRSGLFLPAISLGFWHNFGYIDRFKNCQAVLFRAFDLGITHFDLANNYGSPPGSAEETFGKILKMDLFHYRDELIISTKAGYLMWPGPYGEWGSKKYLVASLDQSLKRMGLEYVDIFYSHRPDPKTPLEETMDALVHVISKGKALYAGISNYSAAQTKKAVTILKELGVHCLIHQPKYSMLERWIERDLLDVLKKEGVGSIAFSPLAQGLLTSRYLHGIPSDSRAAKPNSFLRKEDITRDIMDKMNALNQIAKERGQSLAQMAIAWVLREDCVTSCLVGASKPSQVEENVRTLENRAFTKKELYQIDAILKNKNDKK